MLGGAAEPIEAQAAETFLETPLRRPRPIPVGTWLVPGPGGSGVTSAQVAMRRKHSRWAGVQSSTTARCGGIWVMPGSSSPSGDLGIDLLRW